MNEHKPGRRRFLERAALTVPSVAAVVWLAPSRTAAAGNASKADFHYQDHPNEGSRCANCVAFTPPPSGQLEGSCSIVAGPVSPNGWCMAFSPK